MKKTENIMGTRPILPLLISMAVPPMISMLIQSMYNIVDSIFVAQIGENALTAVSLAYPLQNLVLAVAVGLGVGINSCIAISIGAKDQEKINKVATHGIFLTAVHAICFIFIGLFLTKPFIGIFTNNEEIFRLGTTYSYIVICFSFGSLFHIAIEKMFQATGNMIVPMILQGIGAIINIILDPIMIFGMFGFPKMGVAGAAIATIIGQIVACMLAVILFIKKSGGIHIKLKGFKFEKDVIKKIYSIAVPSGIMMSLPSILIGVLNGILVSISQIGVAILGLYFKLQTFVYMPANGVIQGMRPIISYNYGAKNHKRLLETIKVSLFIVGLIMTIGMSIFLFFPNQILMMFSASDQMMDIGVTSLRIISVGFIISSIGIVFSGMFEALGRGIESLTISLIRQLIIIPPLSFILVKIIGINGVWISFPIAEIIAATASLIIFKRMLKEISISSN